MNYENYMRNNKRYDSEAIIDALYDMIYKLKNHENIDDYVEWMTVLLRAVHRIKDLEYIIKTTKVLKSFTRMEKK